MLVIVSPAAQLAAEGVTRGAVKAVELRYLAATCFSLHAHLDGSIHDRRR